MADGATVCGSCTDALRADLREVPGLLQALGEARYRQTRMGGQPIGVLSGGHDRPLPYDPRAAVAAEDLRVETATLRALGGVAYLRQADDGPAVQRALRATVRRAREVVDRPEAQLYAGPCREQWTGRSTGQRTPQDAGDWTCCAHLYARPDAVSVTCRHCGAVHDVGARKQWLLAVLEDQLATATELSKALSRLELPVSAAVVWKWAERGRLTARGTEPTRGAPLYRVGDVIDLLHEQAARTTRKASA